MPAGRGARVTPGRAPLAHVPVGRDVRAPWLWATGQYLPLRGAITPYFGTSTAFTTWITPLDWFTSEMVTLDALPLSSIR